MSVFVIFISSYVGFLALYHGFQATILYYIELSQDIDIDWSKRLLFGVLSDIIPHTYICILHVTLSALADSHSQNPSLLLYFLI
jgi:hypothetical protein